jgi:hypothetical protein
VDVLLVQHHPPKRINTAAISMAATAIAAAVTTTTEVSQSKLSTVLYYCFYDRVFVRDKEGRG